VKVITPIGQRDRALVELAGHLPGGDPAVLDFEQVREVRVDLNRQVHLVAFVQMVGDDDLLDPNEVDEPSAHD